MNLCGDENAGNFGWSIEDDVGVKAALMLPMQTKQSGVSENDSGAASEDKGSTDD